MNNVKKEAVDKLNHQEKPTATSVCTACNGVGINPESDGKQYCDACKGSGKVTVKAP